MINNTNNNCNDNEYDNDENEKSLDIFCNEIKKYIQNKIPKSSKYLYGFRITAVRMDSNTFNLDDNMDISRRIFCNINTKEMNEEQKIIEAKIYDELGKENKNTNTQQISKKLKINNTIKEKTTHDDEFEDETVAERCDFCDDGVMVWMSWNFSSNKKFYKRLYKQCKNKCKNEQGQTRKKWFDDPLCPRSKIFYLNEYIPKIETQNPKLKKRIMEWIEVCPYLSET